MVLAALLAACLPFAAPASALTAAADKVDVTPDLKNERTYIAGYGAVGRKPQGVHDRLYARLLVVSDGKKTVAIAGFDLLGLYHNDVEELRRLSGFDSPDRYLLVAATHDHSGPDTLGLWGPFIGVSGINPRYHARIRAQVAQRLKAMLGEMEDVKLAAGNATLDPRGLCRDSRDPVVIDPNLGVLTLKRKDGSTLASVVNWSCHPEVLGRDNKLLTADFPGPLCARVEAKTGGHCVYLSGAIGGLMTPDNSADNFYESYRIGTELADKAVEAIKKAAPAQGAPRVAVKTERPLVPVENSRYLLFLPALAYGHDLLDASGKPLPRWKRYWLPLRHLVRRLPEAARPRVRTEVSVVDIGPARLLGIPGEIFPELVIGGYDGRYRFGWPAVNQKEAPPLELEKAPKGPYLRDLIKSPVKLVVGLANDELGYIVPPYDFKTRPSVSMLPRYPGHYEETNSIGPSAAPILVESATRLLSAP